MRRLTLIAALGLCAARLAAVSVSDTFGYVGQDTPIFWNDIRTSGTLIPLASFAPNSDDGSTLIDLPFTFKFYGAGYSKVSVATNGYLQFGVQSAYFGNSCVNANLAPYGIAAGYWIDLDPGLGGEIRYQTQGISPNRATIFQFTSVTARVGGGDVTFQMVLFEGANDILVQYLSTSGNGSGSLAVAGLRSYFDCPNRSGLAIACQQPFLTDSLAIRYSYPSPEPSCGTPTRTGTLTATESPTSSITPTFSISPTFSASPSFSASPTETPTFSASPSATESPTFTASPTVTPTFSPSPTSTASPSASETATISPTFSASPSASDTGTLTGTPSETPQASQTYSASPTATRTPIYKSDVFGYTLQETSFNWIDISGSAPALNFDPNNDDGAVNFDMGFNFKFYGATYQSISISTNGLIRFSGYSTEYADNCLNAAGSPLCIVAPFWTDLDPSAGGSVHVAVLGSAPLRMAVIQWQNVQLYQSANTITVEAILSETLNSITLQYFDTASTSFGATASSGIRSYFDCPNRTGLEMSCDQAALFPNLAVIFTYPSIEPACGTPTYTRSMTASPTPSYSETPTATATASETETASPTQSASFTESSTFSESPTYSASPTESITATLSPSFTHSGTISPTSSRSATPTRTATVSRTATLTATETFSISPTFTVTATYTASPTSTPTPVPPAVKPGCLALGVNSLSSTGTGATTAAGLSNPGGIAIDTRSFPYRAYVADTNHHRVLIWNDVSAMIMGMPANGVLGQVNFTASSANQGGSTAANSLNGPEGLAVDPNNGALWVADSGNHRILHFTAPVASLASADLLLGQADFTSSSANRGGPAAADSLNLPMQVACDSFSRLAVADRNNHRVLYFSDPTLSTSANQVWGQGGSFSTALNNLGSTPSSASLSFPQGVAIDASRLWVSDTANHRVMGYSLAPLSQTAFVVLGQVNFNANLAGQGSLTPSAQSLSSPQGLGLDSSGRLFVADSGFSRVLGWNPLFNPNADLIYGQSSFTSLSATVGSDSLNGPRSVAANAPESLWVADSVNQRVLIYGCGNGVGIATPTATPTQTATISPTATQTATRTATYTFSASPTRSATPTPSATRSSSPTQSASATESPTHSVTGTYSASPTPSITPTATASPSLTQTPIVPPTATPYPRVSDGLLVYPNPSSQALGRACVAFAPGQKAEVTVFDLLGEKIAVWDKGQGSANQGWACWDLKNSSGATCAPGLYYLMLVVDGKLIWGKMTIRP